MKSQTTDKKKILANHKPDKDLVSRVYKELYKHKKESLPEWQSKNLQKSTYSELWKLTKGLQQSDERLFKKNSWLSVRIESSVIL